MATRAALAYLLLAYLLAMGVPTTAADDRPDAAAERERPRARWFEAKATDEQGEADAGPEDRADQAPAGEREQSDESEGAFEAVVTANSVRVNTPVLAADTPPVRAGRATDDAVVADVATPSIAPTPTDTVTPEETTPSTASSAAETSSLDGASAEPASEEASPRVSEEKQDGQDRSRAPRRILLDDNTQPPPTGAEASTIARVQAARSRARRLLADAAEADDAAEQGQDEQAPPSRERTLLGFLDSSFSASDNGTDDSGSQADDSAIRRLLDSNLDMWDLGPPGDPATEARRRRALLFTMSVSGDNTAFAGFAAGPERFHDPRTGPEVTQARFAGNAHVVRAGNYWRASRANRGVSARAQKARLAASGAFNNFGSTSGEGVLGQQGKVGINQHDRIGVNKAHAWHDPPHRPTRCGPGAGAGACIVDAEVSRASSPARGTHDPHVTNGRQPYVTGVTSYTPNRRSDHNAYRSMWRVSSITIPSIVSSDVVIYTIGEDSLAVGDKVYLSGIRGGTPQSGYLSSSLMLAKPEDAFNCGQVTRSANTDQRVRALESCANEFTVTSVGTGVGAYRSFTINFWTVHSVTTDAQAATYAGRILDVAGATAHRAITSTRANPEPLVPEHGWSYESNDRIYIMVSFSTPVVVTGSPRLRLHTGHHFENGASDAYAVFAGGGYGESKSLWKNNAPNPLKHGRSDINSYHQQIYELNTGACTNRRSWVCDGAADQDTPATDSDACMAWAKVNPTTPLTGTPKLWCTATNTPAGCETRITTPPASSVPKIHAGSDDAACDDYGGITRTADARVRTRGCHDFKIGDLVAIEGVTGIHADLVNKLHTIGQVGCQAQSTLGTGGPCACNDEFSMDPPLNLLNAASCTGRPTCEFDAGLARVGRVNIGSRCRSHGLADGTKHGDRYCTFSTLDRYQQGDAVLSLGSGLNTDAAGATVAATTPSLTHLPQTAYAGASVSYTAMLGALENVGGGESAWGTQTGRRHSAGGASFGFRADANAGTIPTLRQELQFPEDRREQSMDKTLVFEYTVTSGGSTPDNYNQGLPTGNTGEVHLSRDLDYSSVDALELNGGTISRACPFTYIVESGEVTANGLRMKVIGQHGLTPGEYVRIENAGGTHRFQLNGVHEVLGVYTNVGGANPAIPGSTKVAFSNPTGTVAPPFDRAGTQAAAHGDSYILLPTPAGIGLGALGTGAVVAGKTIVRRYYNPSEGGHLSCTFAAARLTLPKMGDKLGPGMAHAAPTHAREVNPAVGAVGSLSFHKNLVVGRAHIMYVTADAVDGTYGYNAGALGANSVPDVIDVKVVFSEPVVPSCGTTNTDWASTEHLAGLFYTVCTSIQLALRTRENTNDSNGTPLNAAHPNYDTTKGTAGTEVFPTAYLMHPTVVGLPAASQTLVFRYVVRRQDITPRLTFRDQDGLLVSGTSSIRRATDNMLAGVRLPPTRYDAGDVYTNAAAPLNRHTANNADHPLSLGGMRRLDINANF